MEWKMKQCAPSICLNYVFLPLCQHGVLYIFPSWRPLRWDKWGPFGAHLRAETCVPAHVCCLMSLLMGPFIIIIIIWLKGALPLVIALHRRRPCLCLQKYMTLRKKRAAGVRRSCRGHICFLWSGNISEWHIIPGHVVHRRSHCWWYTPCVRSLSLFLSVCSFFLLSTYQRLYNIIEKNPNGYYIQNIF